MASVLVELVAQGSVLVPQAWKISEKKKDQKTVLLGFYGGFII